MESRQLLATFVVTSNDDSGPGTLRQAILNANTLPNINTVPDEIVFNLSRVADQFATGSNPVGITAHPDGNLYFTGPGVIGRLTPAGAVTLFPTGADTNPVGITVGPDNALWFTDRDGTPSIGRINTDGTGLMLFALPADSTPNEITAGPDGNLWFTDNARIGRITTGGTVTFFATIPGTTLGGITVGPGPDQNLFFTITGGSFSGIGRITTAGVITEFPQAGAPVGITLGPDGNLWATDQGLIPQILRITPNGGITPFFLPANTIPVDIANGGDGNLYFTVSSPSPAIGRITPTGQIDIFNYGGGSAPVAITLGPGGGLFFTEPASGQIGRFDLTDAFSTISPLSPLPTITEAVDINGYSQAGSVINDTIDNRDEEGDIAVLVVQIDGALAGVGADGLRITAANSLVSGLQITRFDGAGIALEGAGAVGNSIFGNFIGVLTNDAAPEFNAAPITLGTNTLGNGAGLRVSGSNNRIGATLPAGRNVIQGNRGDGIQLLGIAGTGNLIEANFILDNQGDGVDITSSNNVIGEPIGAGPSGGGNVISGNGGRGIYILGASAEGNLIQNNEIGTSVRLPNVQLNLVLRGIVARPNQQEGIRIEDSPGNLVGGTVANARNAIGANGSDGIRILGVTATNNVIQGNSIGFNNRGGSISILPNRDGINISSANNVVGGSTAGARNAIANNARHGVVIAGAAATGNRVSGNFIGTIGGGDDFGNTFDGILIDNATDTIIGGTTEAERNVISGNNNGVTILGAGSTGNLVLGNFIGTASDGVTDLGNAVDGVRIIDASRNTIGGTTAGARNVISGNDRGVRVAGLTAINNAILGNFIGTDLNGVGALGNEIDGVILTNVVEGPLRDASDADIVVNGPSSQTAVGGTAAGAANTVAFNSGTGVLVELGTGNAILSNRIFSNNLLGIDLAPIGVTANDPLDADAGPNTLQNFPVLVRATPATVSTVIEGSLNSTPNTTFTVQFFASAATDPTNFGEGQTFVGSTSVTTDAAGDATFTVTLPTVVTSGQSVTATATDPNGNTSEFSAAVPSEPIVLQFSDPTFTVTEAGVMATITVTRIGGAGGAVAVDFATADGTATAGADYAATTGTLTFGPGVNSRTFTIPILQDGDAEGNETVNLTLSNPTNGATLGTQSTAVLTIQDDEAVTVQFQASMRSVAEGAGQIVVTVTRNSTVGTSTVNFAATAGTATAGGDFTPISGTLTFNPGESVKTFAVAILQDGVTEAAETINLALSNPTGASLGNPSTATITINDDDQPGTLQFASRSFTVAENGGQATITVERVGGTTGTLTAQFSTGAAAPGASPATPNVDFTPVSGTLTFAPGETVKTFVVPILDDGAIEGNEAFSVSLQSGNTLDIAGVTIIDDDFPFSFQFDSPNPVVRESMGTALVTISRIGGLGGPVTVNLNVAGGSATPGADFGAVATVVAFGPGETVKTVAIPIVDDSLVEGNETIVLSLSNPSTGGSIGNPATSTLTILDNDIDSSGPIVTDLRLSANARGINGVTISFSEPLDPARASNLGNYEEFVSVGRDGRIGTGDDRIVPIVRATYDPATARVTLVPARPLARNTFHVVRINAASSTGTGVADVTGNLLDGDFDGLAGGPFGAQFGLGRRLVFADRDGDIVDLVVRNGGQVEAVRGLDGDIRQVRLVGTRPGRSIFAAHLTQVSPAFTSPIPVIFGAAGTQVRFNSPPFQVGTISAAAVDALLGSAKPGRKRR